MALSLAKQQLGFLHVLQEVTRLIATARDPQRVMELVVERLPGLLAVDAATIRLLDEGTNTFVLGAAYGLSDEYLARSIIDSQEVMTELRRGQPAASHGLDRHCNHEGCDLVLQEGVKNVLSLPILQHGEVIGILRLVSRSRRRFDQQETDFAMALAEQVGIAISRARITQELEQQVSYLTELRSISQLVHSTLDLDDVLHRIVDKLPAIMDLKGCTIRLLEPASNRLQLMAASGLSEEYLARGSISREDSLFTVLRGEPVAIYDASRDPRVDHHQAIAREGISSILAVPIKNGAEVIGIMRLLTAEHHLFTPGEIAFAMSVAEESGSAIDKARTFRQISLLFNQLEEQERFLQTIMDSLWMQLLVMSADRRVVMANRMFLDSQGLTEREVLGRRYEAVSPWATANHGFSPFDAVLAGGAPVAILDDLAERDEVGGRRWFERHLTPILGTAGEVEFIIEAVLDITDQKLLEQERLQRKKLEGVLEMAGTAAHQLNSPLFAALGTAQLLQDDLDSPALLEDLATIIRNLQTMAALTRRMTEATGFENQQYVGQARIIDLKGQ